MNCLSKNLASVLACILILTGAFIAGCANPQLSADSAELPDSEPSDPEPDPIPVPPVEPEPDPPIVVRSTILIDFDSAVPGIVGEAFAAAGLMASPGPGQLDADAWSILGFSDGDLDFGEEASTGDLARGVSPGGVSTGGLYAFTVDLDNSALGVQPTASDFAPGSIILKTVLPAAVLIGLELDYRMWTLNDQDRSTIWSTSYSFDGSTWVELVAIGHTTPILADATPLWSGTSYMAAVSLENETFAAGNPFYLRWDAIGGDGGGSRDESAIDDISLTFIYEE